MEYPKSKEFNKLDEDKQKEVFMKIFIENNGEEFSSKYYDWSKHTYVEAPHYSISRKFKENPGQLSEYEMNSVILTYENNKLVFKKTTSQNDYTTIYNLHNKFCVDCGNDSMGFDYGDKSYTYVCSSYCTKHFEKEFFHRHGRQYLQDYNYGY